MFPKQASESRAPIVYRDLITIWADAAPGGSGNPLYTTSIGRDVSAEVMQVSGGETVRGHQVDQVTAFVVGMRDNPLINPTSRLKVEVTSGQYKGQVLYTHRVLRENAHGRPARLQLHCKGGDL
jgi:hypothetical protein